MQYVGYSMTTGQKIWGPIGNQDALAFYWMGYSGQGAQVAYGNLYSCSNMAGIVYCFDLKTGTQLWSYGNGGEGNSTHSGFEVPGPYPTIIYAIGNDVVYTVTSEHTVETPIYKGALTRAINAHTGEEIWTLSNDNNAGSSAAAIADGYATIANGYDNQIYVIGRGSSLTTATAGPKVQTFGNNVIIEGTIMDSSSGTKQEEQIARFPNGVPCASDASMSDWMSYIYQQQPFPTDFTGVEVSIDVFDSNGNYRNIGTATTDAKGMYSFTWTPDIPGDFKVIVTFAGTNGYWPSSSETVFNVMPAPEATVAPTASPASLADQYMLPGIGVIVAAIAVVGAVIVLMLRKK